MPPQSKTPFKEFTHHLPTRASPFSPPHSPQTKTTLSSFLMAKMKTTTLSASLCFPVLPRPEQQISSPETSVQVSKRSFASMLGCFLWSFLVWGRMMLLRLIVLLMLLMLNGGVLRFSRSFVLRGGGVLMTFLLACVVFDVA